MFLMAIPGGQVFGMYLFAAGIGLFLYDNVDFIRQLVNGMIGMIIDGLKWLGNWLVKIGEAIWKTLTWLWDVLAAHGDAILAMLIYALAVVIPVAIIWVTIKFMSMIEHISRGDLRGAAKEGSEIVSAPRRIIRGGS
jgi:hypothetical protein